MRSDYYHAYVWGGKVIMISTLFGVWLGWWWGELTCPEDADTRALHLFGPGFH